MPQIGRVIIHDDVEIGANSTIDRGGMTDTVIGAGSRIDNLVQIAHGVRIGRCCVLVAQSGIAGSSVLEDYVQMGGQAGVVGHVHIGRGAKVAGAVRRHQRRGGGGANGRQSRAAGARLDAGERVAAARDTAARFGQNAGQENGLRVMEERLRRSRPSANRRAGRWTFSKSWRRSRIATRCC